MLKKEGIMEKLLILLLFILTTDLHASGIASNTNSAPCTNNTLETYSGNSNLAADWQPNEIQLRWYNGNTLMNVQSSANTCVYDSTLTIPQTAPTRVGYTFDGWTVRPEYDFGTIPSNENGLERWMISENLNTHMDKCRYDTTGSSSQVFNCNNSGFSDLKRDEWKVRFNHGILYGMSICGTQSNGNNPGNSGGEYCWCKLTGYKPVNQNTIYAPSSSMPWVLYGNSPCQDDYGCSAYCAQYLLQQKSWRRALLGQ